MDLFEIKFPTISRHNHPKTLGTFKVYTTNPELISIFLKQHAIDVYEVKIMDIEAIANLDERLILEEYKFHSNTDGNTYTIITAYKLLVYAIYHVGGNLGDTLMLGDLILRNEIQIIDIISHLIESLPYVTIAEHVTIDTETCTDKQLLDKLTKYSNKYNGLMLDYSEEDQFYEYIYDELGGAIPANNDVKCNAISLEGYIEFVATLSNRRFLDG